MQLNLPPITLALLLACVAAFFAQQSGNAQIVEQFALWPLGPRFHIWQLLSHFLLHADVPHLIFNMLGLVTFGRDLERLWGPQRYIQMILVSTLLAGLAQEAMSYATDAHVPAIGASGGIFGLLLAYALTFPYRTILLIFPPIPMPAWVFALIFGGIELFSGITGTMPGIAHFAHLGGMLGALILMALWRLEDPRTQR